MFGAMFGTYHQIDILGTEELRGLGLNSQNIENRKLDDEYALIKIDDKILVRVEQLDLKLEQPKDSK